MPYTDEEKKEAEESKLTHDYLKHLTSLSTGSVLVTLAFVEKLFPQPQWQDLFGFAIACFLLSFIAAVVTMTINIKYMHDPAPRGLLAMIGGYGLLVTWAFLFVGLVSLAVFALKNLY